MCTLRHSNPGPTCGPHHCIIVSYTPDQTCGSLGACGILAVSIRSLGIPPPLQRTFSWNFCISRILTAGTCLLLWHQYIPSLSFSSVSPCPHEPDPGCLGWGTTNMRHNERSVLQLPVSPNAEERVAGINPTRQKRLEKIHHVFYCTFLPEFWLIPAHLHRIWQRNLPQLMKPEPFRQHEATVTS